MSQLNRIGEVLGSFVSGDFKRKRLDESADMTDADDSPNLKKMREALGENQINDTLSAPAFLSRVSTFKDTAWCRNIAALSPLEVARHGWYSIDDEFMVRCITCKENLSLAIPPKETRVRDNCISTAAARLTSAHGEFCPWNASPNPIDWTRVQMPDMDLVAKTACKIATLGVKLPFIRSEFEQPWKSVMKGIDMEPYKDIEDFQVQQTSCLLAMCGWKLGSLEETLQDLYGCRRLGLWNFVSIQDEEDILEAQKVSAELGQTVDTETHDLKPEGKEYLNPLGEHFSWHPLLQKRDGVIGWKNYINQVKVSQYRDAEPEFKREKRDSISVIRRVRDLLENW